MSDQRFGIRKRAEGLGYAGTARNQFAIGVLDDGNGIGRGLQNSGLKASAEVLRQRVKQFGEEVRPENANPGTLVEVVLPFREKYES